MTGHEPAASMLIRPDELSLADQASLARHLRACPDCRLLAALYADNRERLRVLAQTRPPEALRESVLDRAAGAREAAGFYIPVALSFAAIPLSLIAVGLILVYGAMALLGLGVLFAAFAGLTIRRSSRLERLSDVPRLPPEISLSCLARGLLADAAGVAAGTLLLALLVALIVAIAGVVR